VSQELVQTLAEASIANSESIVRNAKVGILHSILIATISVFIAFYITTTQNKIRDLHTRVTTLEQVIKGQHNGTNQ
jgi:hypothetical protein